MSGGFRANDGKILRISVPLVAGIVIALCGLLVWKTDHLRKQQQWVEQSYQVRVEVETVDRSLREAESVQRAFLLTQGDSDLMDRFKGFRRNAIAHLAELRKLVADNPMQAAQVARLAGLLEERLQGLERNATELKLLSVEQREARFREGIALADRIDREVEKIREYENRVLEERAGDAARSETRMLVMAFSGSSFGVVVLFLTAWLERRRREENNRYQARLAEARDAALDAVKTTSNFVASVSHEIRTPMNGVLGAADLLFHDARLNGKQRELVETIRISGQSLLDLINDILDLSKLRAGKMDFVREDFTLSDTIEEVLSLFADPAGRKRLDLTYRIAPEVPQAVCGDARRLRQVLINLVGNAIKFTDRGSVLIEVDMRAGEKGRLVLRFRVTDTGPGISAEQQERLFEPFTQVNASLSRRHHGTGLGLAISREIVHHFEGSMGVESQLGEGAAFWFTACFHAAHSAEHPSTRLCRGGALLLIEGRYQTAHSIEHHALAWGMKVIVVSDTSGLKALSPVKDLVAVVIGQPLGSSWQKMAALLQTRPDLENAPRFVLAPLHESIPQEQLEAAGVRDTLRFPFRPSDLYNLLADERSGAPSGHGELISRSPEAFRIEWPEAKILLVEDNPVNQRVFTRQLEALGLKVDIREDGPDGVEARCNGGYDAILMDCQLPTMDGFEASRQIRAWESQQNAKRVPIIAVTAHVMAGDAEACFQAGMDDYLPKPFDLSKLQRILGRWLPQADGHEPKAVAPASSAQGGVLDVPQLEACLIGDADADAELLEMSLSEAEDRLREMRESLDYDDDEKWRLSSHRAKGSCATLGFRELAAFFEKAEHRAVTSTDRAVLLEETEASLGRTRGALAWLGVFSRN
jgi:signal transduction histidine kinase/CheY-like chemotaxis protein/HPt (histidine-containing phosphotransfer) domain-containing protein